MAASNKKYIKNCTGENCYNGNSGKTKIISRFLFYFLLVVFFGVSAYILIFSPYLQITSVNITGTQELNKQELEEIVSQSLDGNFIAVIPRNNFFLLTQGRIEKILLDKYKKIRSVSIKKIFPDQMEINIDERKALLILCVGQQDCFLIDENGTAYSQADFNSPDLIQNHLLKIDDQSGLAISLGDKVIDQAFEQYLTSLKDSVKTLGLDVTDQYYTPSRMSQELSADTTSGVRLLLSTQFPLESATRTLAVLLKKEISSEQLKNVEYIDLRSENKAFYKLSGQQESEQSSAGEEVANKKSDEKKK